MALRPQRVLAPDQIQLNQAQADRLANISGVPAAELVGQTVAQIGDKLRFRIDPQLLLFRKICGRVVKKDPATGKEFPVPFATVHVEDTDCSLLGYFPAGGRWAWYFPFRCRREVIGTVKTDACGKFCVWIPRFEIDWVLRWRRERFCFETLFERPSLRDLLEELKPRVPIPRPGPIPEPEPRIAFEPGLLRQVEDLVGEASAKQLGRLQSQLAFGASRAELDAADLRIPPPLPPELRDDGKDLAGSLDSLRSTLAARLKLDRKDLARFDPRRVIGPFKRCIDLKIKEWTPILDVPDVTFRVTQDINGDGTEEVIYSEGYFQVRWNAGNLGEVVLEAQPQAKAGLDCGDGSPIPCGNLPAIVLAGRMPVVDAATIYDSANGYALRPNRPHPSALFLDALPNPDAAAPFTGTLTLFGCNRTDPGATHYRILHKYSANSGASFSAYVPFVGLSWPLFRLDALGHLESHFPAADADGWYPIALPPGPNPFLPQDILLDWPSRSFADGRYVLKLELGTGGAVTSSSAEVAFNIANAAPLARLTVEWRRGSVGAFQPLGNPCPVVRRGHNKVAVEFRVRLEAASSHLRSAHLAASDCGDGHFEFLSGSGTPANHLQTVPGVGAVFGHWHTSPADNSLLLEAIYRLPETASQGTYGFGAIVASRAFNPNDGVGHLPSVSWEYDPAPSYSHPSLQFSVIDQD